MAKDYDGLDRWGKQVVRSVIDDEMERCEDEARFLAGLRLFVKYKQRTLETVSPL